MTSIREFVPGHFLTGDKTLLKAIRIAVDQNADRLNKMIEAGIDQQFISTATGRYLLFLGEQEGFAMPPNSGLDIRALRALVPAMVASPKQVVSTLNRLIEIFYTTEKVKPSTVASVSEPYNLASGDDLIVETESGQIAISILADQVSDITSVTSAELAGVINNSQSLYVADTYVNRRSNERFLRITSRTFGVGAFVRVIGGTAQNILKFPKLRETDLQVGTTWNVTKDATYTDVTKFTWDGVGTNPLVYKIKPGDVATIRGLVDGVDQLSLLNGSYKIIDAGYDYFVVYNDHFPFTSATIVQPAVDSIVFTSSDKNTLYDLEEYAILSETTDATTTITVPAIPPLARRFLAGSAHLHGTELPVTDFTRSTITVDDTFGEVSPDQDNVFTIFSKNHRYKFEISNLLRTNGSDNSSPRTYLLDYSDEEYAVLPFTAVQPTGNNSLYAEPGSEEFILTCPFKHGLHNYWGFTLATTSQVGNITSGMINKEHQVSEAVTGSKVKFFLYDANGAPIKFSGVTFSNFDVWRYSTMQSDDSDFYLEFPTSGDVTTSGLTVGAVFRIDGSAGTNIDPFWGEKLRHARLVVKSINGNIVNFFAGFGAQFGGKMIDSAIGYRSANWGGIVTYFFDKTSSHNQEFVMSTLFTSWLGYTPSVNSAYVGSYLFDSTGLYSQNTMSGAIVKNAQTILKGSNQIAVFADSVEGFPSSGYLMINYGSHTQEGPIFFLSVIDNQTGNSQILIDPAYRFQFTHNVGENIQYIHKLAPYVPTEDGADFPVYLTGTAQARNTMLTLLRLLIATGVFLDFQVLFPELRFDDTAIQPFE